MFPDFVLHEIICQVGRIIQIEGFDGHWGEPEAVNRVQAIGRFAHVIHDHDGVSKTSIADNHLHEVLVRKRETKLAADVEPDFVA